MGKVMKFSEYLKEFGFKLFIVNGFSRVMRILRIRKDFIQKYEIIKNKCIINWIKRNCISEKVKKVNMEYKHLISPNSTIWVFWWQGIESAPKIVKECYKSIIKYSGKHNVVLVTKNNYYEYVTIPGYVINKLENGQMSKTHFSDILRFALLAEYGGIWMDATIYLTDYLPKDIYNLPYYTLRGCFKEWEWSGFFQATGEQNDFFSCVRDTFYVYWKNHNQLITYLLIDCTMKAIYDLHPELDNMIYSVKKVDNSVFLLNDEYLDTVYDDKKWNHIKEKTFIHKLSYKFMHESYIYNKKTFWGFILDE